MSVICYANWLFWDWLTTARVKGLCQRLSYSPEIDHGRMIPLTTVLGFDEVNIIYAVSIYIIYIIIYIYYMYIMI